MGWITLASRQSQVLRIETQERPCPGTGPIHVLHLPSTLNRPTDWHHHPAKKKVINPPLQTKPCRSQVLWHQSNAIFQNWNLRLRFQCNAPGIRVVRAYCLLLPYVSCLSFVPQTNASRRGPVSEVWRMKKSGAGGSPFHCALDHRLYKRPTSLPRRPGTCPYCTPSKSLPSQNSWAEASATTRVAFGTSFLVCLLGGTHNT
jgi:hypothetical protein